MTQQQRKQKRPTSAWRAVLFRLFAVALGLAPLLFAEGLFIFFGWGQPTEMDDPYISFAQLSPLFVLDEAGENFEIPPSRQQFFRPQSFPLAKKSGTYRIFCLGGSTVQGRPYAVETSFTTWLGLSLQAADASKQWEVVNCGGVSYASYRLVPIMQELLSHQADLFIIYTGHNEFLEDRSYQKVKQTPALLAQSHYLMSRLRTYSALRQSWNRLRNKSSAGSSAKQTVLKGEVEAMLDFRDGLQDYHRDDDWRSSIIQHFHINLRRLIAIANKANVPVILVNPVSNLKDTPPFKVAHSENLTSEQRDRFDSLRKQAQTVEAGKLDEECRLLREAIEIDSRHAGVHFHLGKCYELLNQFEKAKLEFIQAKDEDICPLRIIEPMHEIILRVSRQTNTPLVDIRQRFESLCEGGIPGNQYLKDHVHPTIVGHQVIAEALLEKMVQQKMVRPATDWKNRRDEMFRNHQNSLDLVYFERAEQRLQGLRRWTQGRALRLRPSPKTSNSGSANP